jgi:hexosaminidase
VGSIRKETILEKNFDPYVGDGIPYGGYYTQDEIRDVVRYAAERFVTIVPEIEMPGHSTAALAPYPELGCTDGPFEVATTWGVKEDIYCPSEATFTFLTNVLDEVMTLFPGEMIHVGGDEAPKRRWRESPLAQEVIRNEGLADEDELQSWFIHRIERYLNDHGRRLIGWDEILEGGLAPNATVMSWRGEEGGIEAARQGNDAVMTPKTYVYLDYYQGQPEDEPLAIGGFLPLDSVYAFDPLPDVLTADQATHILGGQANVWTEYIATPEHAEYMTYPRAIAVAEAVWSTPGRRSFADFMDRLSRNLDHLQVLGVNFRVPEAFRSP